jgi:hypothetical protein
VHIDSLTRQDVALVWGYLASALVVAASLMRSRARMRALAFASNIAFIAYGSLGHCIPVLALNALLLPLNFCRLSEIGRTNRQIRAAIDGGLRAERREPFARGGAKNGRSTLWQRRTRRYDVFHRVGSLAASMNRNRKRPTGEPSI